MANKNLYGVKGQLQQPLDAFSVVATVDSVLSGVIAASIVQGVDHAYFAIRSANIYELVKVTGVVGTTLIIERNQDGGGAKIFPVGATLEFEVTALGILEQLSVPPTTVTLTGGGVAQVDNPSANVFDVTVAQPTFTGANGIDVTGNWPNYEISVTQNADECCGDSTSTSGVAVTNLVGEGLVTAYVNGDEGIINVPVPTFNGINGITVTGAWPDFTISATFGTGTVTSVNAGTGLTLTGSATVNPTLSITATGVAAGTYGGIQINAQGQIVSVPATLNPVSIINANAPLTYSRAGDAVTLGVTNGAVGVVGAVELADETDPFNPADNTTAATPAVVALALSTIGTSVQGANSYTGESDGTYTNTISGSSLVIDIASGKKALISAEVAMVDGTTPLTPVAFGMAVFSSVPAKLKSNRIVTQSIQNMQFVIDGPLSTTIAIVTTAVPGGASITAYSLNVIEF